MDKKSLHRDQLFYLSQRFADQFVNIFGLANAVKLSSYLKTILEEKNKK